MPLYEYYCQTCTGSFEKLTSAAKADDAQVCPNCASEQTSRQLSSFAFSGGSAAPAMTSAPASSPFTCDGISAADFQPLYLSRRLLSRQFVCNKFVFSSPRISRISLIGGDFLEASVSSAESAVSFFVRVSCRMGLDR